MKDDEKDVVAERYDQGKGIAFVVKYGNAA
jgi:hypothetical protein